MKHKGQLKFFIILFLTILIGVVFSTPGAFIHDHSWINTGLIMLMYLGIGISLDTNEVVKGILKWKEICFAQFILFILSPLIALLLYCWLVPYSNKETMIGLIFVSSLATTISSGIMLTESLNGNSVLSMYNVIISQLLGVFAAPLIISIVLKTQFSMSVGIISIIKDLIINMILPFIVGQCMFKFREILKPYAKFISNYSIFVILYSYIGYAQLNGYLVKIFSDLFIPTISVFLFAILLIMFVISSTKLLKFNTKDRISLVFSCSMKTMGMGIPMALMFFPNNPSIALNVSLLIIIYYIFSMILSVLLVNCTIIKREDTI